MKAPNTAIMIAAALVMSGSGAGEALDDRVGVGEAGASRLGHARDEEDLVVHAQAEDGAEDESGTVGKIPCSGPPSPTRPAPWPSWNTITHAPKLARHREQVEGHGLERDEQRAEGEEEDHERRQHERDDEVHPPLDGVLVVGVEGGQAAHAQAGALEAREHGRVGPPQLSHEVGDVPGVDALPRDDLEQGHLAVRAEEHPLHHPREQRHVGEVVGALGGDRRQRQHAGHAGVRRQVHPEPALRVPARVLGAVVVSGSSITTRSDSTIAARPIARRSAIPRADSMTAAATLRAGCSG